MLCIVRTTEESAKQEKALDKASIGKRRTYVEVPNREMMLFCGKLMRGIHLIRADEIENSYNGHTAIMRTLY